MTDDEESHAVHRQFFLDRLAINTKIDNRPPLGKDFKWWFHGYTRADKNRSGYRGKDVTDALKHLKKLPTRKKIGQASLGVESGNPGTSDLSSKVKVFGLKAWLLDKGKEKLLDGMGEELIELLINKETHDLK